VRFGWNWARSRGQGRYGVGLVRRVRHGPDGGTLRDTVFTMNPATGTIDRIASGGEHAATFGFTPVGAVELASLGDVSVTTTGSTGDALVERRLLRTGQLDSLQWWRTIGGDQTGEYVRWHHGLAYDRGGLRMSMAISMSPLVANKSLHLAGVRLGLPPGGGAGLGFSHAERFAVGGDDDGVVQEAVEHRGGGGLLG